MSKKCMSCGELNELHTSNHPAACMGILKVKVEELGKTVNKKNIQIKSLHNLLNRVLVGAYGRVPSMLIADIRAELKQEDV